VYQSPVSDVLTAYRHGKAHNPLPAKVDLVHNVVILLQRWCVYRRRRASDGDDLSFVLVDWAIAFVGLGGAACGTERSEAIAPSPRRDLRTVGVRAGWDETGEDQRARPAVLAAFVEISDADSVFQYRVLF